MIFLILFSSSSCNRRLYLSDNIISDVNRGTFANIRRIGTIDIARNLITKIDFEMFAQLNYIEVVFFLNIDALVNICFILMFFLLGN